MRALTSAVISFELLIIILFIPAALQKESLQPNLIITISIFLLIFGLSILGILKKRLGLILGHVFQVLMITLGFIVNWMFLLGLIFLALWVTAIKIGKKTDLMKSSLKLQK